jgi:hypothetical protein
MPDERIELLPIGSTCTHAQVAQAFGADHIIIETDAFSIAIDNEYVGRLAFQRVYVDPAKVTKTMLVATSDGDIIFYAATTVARDQLYKTDTMFTVVINSRGV